jgi:MoaA/NifB/PqqE/SkfB family radical SAM enzyme
MERLKLKIRREWFTCPMFSSPISECNLNCKICPIPYEERSSIPRDELLINQIKKKSEPQERKMTF